MIKRVVRLVRLYFAQAWLSYHGRFAITHPFGYITSKIGFPFFLMIFFIFMGKFVGFNDPLYIVIGNILLIPANNGMAGITLAIGDERQWGTLSYVLGSPAPRGPLFVGRAWFYILDGFVTALVGFVIVAGIFHMDLSQVNLILLMLVALLIAITSSGDRVFIRKYRVVIQGWVDDIEHFYLRPVYHGGCEFPDRGAARRSI